MVSEAKLQREIIVWLKSQKCYVIKTKPGPGTPVGCPDIIALYKNKWLALEVKGSGSAPFRPGQLATLAYLKDGNHWVFAVWPENWLQIKQDIFRHFLV